jgi:hypothetical protein
MTDPTRPLHCWADYHASLEWGSEEWVRASVERADATCLLEKGHTGPHEWTPDEGLVVTFAVEIPAAEVRN